MKIPLAPCLPRPWPLRARARLRHLGYWTEVIAASAAKVDAPDLNEETLAVARRKGIPPEKVKFSRGDLDALADLGRSHEVLKNLMGFVA